MYRKIKNNYEIKVIDNVITLIKTDAVNYKYEISKFIAAILMLFDGSRSDSEIEAIVDKISKKNSKWKEIYCKTIKYYSYILESLEIKEDNKKNTIEEIMKVLSIEQSTSIVNRRITPRKIVWLISDKCTRKCIYCYFGKRSYKPIENCISNISFDLVHTMTKECVDLDVEELTLSGGDPLLIENIYDVIYEFQKNKISVSVITKMKIDILQIVRKDYLMFVFSLDSINPKTADYLAGFDGHCRDMMLNIQLCEANNIYFSISITVCTMNLSEVLETVQWFLMNSSGRITITKYICYKNRDNIGEVSDEQYQILYDNIQKLVKNSKCPSERVVFNLPKHENDYFCDSGREKLVIDKYGNAKVCEKSTENINQCNIFAESIIRVWNSKEYKERLGIGKENKWKCPFQ